MTYIVWAMHKTGKIAVCVMNGTAGEEDGSLWYENYFGSLGMI